MADDPKKPYGADASYADPGYQADKKARYPLDTEAHVRAALSFIAQGDNASVYTSEQLASIKAKINAAAKKFNIDVENRNAMLEVEQRPRAPIELRSADVAGLNLDQRIVTVIVAPYDEPTPVMWRNEVWSESFERSAWNGIEGRPNRVRANRAHNRTLTCGKAVNFYPKRAEGLVADIKMAKTPLGDETLELAREDCLSVSAGFGALPSDQIIDRRSKTRRITTAYLDHISFVEDPAYLGASVIEVRENELILPDEEVIIVPAGPSLEDWRNDPIFVKSRNLLSP